MTATKEYKSPFMIVIIDLMDAYHYADVFEEERYKIIANDFVDYDMAIALADRLFWALNPNDRTQKEWYHLDKGWDVHIYDSEFRRLYRAHEKLPEG